MSEKSSFIRKFRLHAITSPQVLKRADFLSVARQIASTATAAIHLRAHHLEGGALYKLALELRKVTNSAHVPLIINDRLDVAILTACDAVQLGRHSIPVEYAAPLCRKHGLVFGCSCHSLEEAREAEKMGAAYIYLGTVFPSASRPRVPACGVELLEKVCSEVDVPVLAIGGVNPSNVQKVAAAGAFGAAAITAFWEAPDVRKNLEKMNRAFKPSAA